MAIEAQLKSGSGLKKARLTRQLIGAAKSGDLASMDVKLARGAKIDGRDSDGSTALMGAAREGQLSAVRYLLSLGAPVDTWNNHGTTPLMMAAANGHDTTVQTLIDAGAHVNYVDNDRKTPLFKAAQYGHSSTCSLLLKLGADMNRDTKSDHLNPLSVAVKNGYADVVRVLLQNGADPNHYSKHGVPALALCRSVLVAELLLRHGADLNATTYFGTTPLIIAVERGDIDLVRLYLERGVDFTRKNAMGRKALTSARYHNITEIKDMLKRAGATE